MDTSEQRDSSYGTPDADRAPDGDENASGTTGEFRDRSEDTSGGPLSSGAGEGSGEGAVEDAPPEGMVGGGGVPFEGEE